MKPESLTDLAVQLARDGEAGFDAQHYSLGKRLSVMDRALRSFAEKEAQRSPRPPVVAWVSDNYPLLHTLIREVKTSVPKPFYAALPRLLKHGLIQDGLPKEKPARIDATLAALVEFTSAKVSSQTLEEFFGAYQKVRILSMAELWSAKHLLHFHLVEVVYREIISAEPALDRVAGAITSLRSLEPFPWKKFVESCLAVEEVLRQDPSGDYAHVDFATRDLYRHAVEQASRRAYRKGEDIADAEVRVARTAVELASQEEGGRRRHIGFWLIDKGVPAFRKAAGYRQKTLGNFRDLIRRFPSFHYLSFWLLFTAGIVFGAMTLLAPVPWWVSLFLLLPAMHVALAMVNPLVTFTLPPKTLARLDFSEGVPAEFKSVVVVPTLLLSVRNVKELLSNLEIHYLANRDRNVLFALLTDFPDSDQPETPNDTLLETCIEGVEDLNERYAATGQQPFYLFHRPRKWNPAEERWMGQERKRGKLNDFNEWLLGLGDGFSAKVGDLDRLRGAKFVITLDSDTQLPRDTARKMIGMLAHPLNRPVLDPVRSVVVEGYGLLLPRVGVSLQSSAKSRLARLYSGKVGYDPYATAVSDVYMDLFGQASFTGKGIYDVEVFEAAAGRFPDNTLLSHDLIEGEHVRVGLCADQEVIDDFPARYEAFSKRKHRWVRGDWQILSWLLPRVPDKKSGHARNPLSLISRWKIFDNLRRSLMEISLLVLFVAAWTFLPGSGLTWTLVALALFVLPVWFDLVVAAIRIPPPRFFRPYVREVSYRFLQGHLDALITLVFLPHQALLMGDAIVRTLVRQFITHKHLLEWESMAAAEASTGSKTSLSTIYLWVGSVLALLLIVIVPGGEPWSNLAFALLELWLVSPLVALWLDSPPAQPRGITQDDRQFLRGVALSTWHYYLDHVTQENSWLIPDNVQEVPAAVAHRTSPTNIGLQLNAFQTALDLGHLTAEEFASYTSRTLESMSRMKRVRGHWLNWYHTKDLRVLPPAYVSTVDSGNLAASLLTLKQGCLEITRRKLLAAADREGLIDIAQAFRFALQRDAGKDSREQASLRAIDSIVAQLANEPADLFFWEGVLAETKAAVERMAANPIWADDSESAYYLQGLRTRLSAQNDQLCRFAPWLAEPLVKEFRFSFSDPAMAELLKALSFVPAYCDLPDHYDHIAAAVRERLEARRSMHELTRHALNQLIEALPKARRRAIELVASLQASARTAASWVDEMEFGFLFDEKRNLLRIGCSLEGNLEAIVPDDSYYDLLASEARTAVLLGIAKGEMPREAWFQLGRKLIQWRGHHCLVSWSGTMFEYLMPHLFMNSYPGTLLHETARAAVKIQQAYAKERRVIWGISESAFNGRDAAENYQYHAFGIPNICARRDFSGRTVIAPYATMLALLVDPLAAVENARHMQAKGWRGRYGFFEAIDYTPPRGFGRGGEPQIVHAFMAHHQGMTLLAISSAVLDSPIQRRFHADALVQAAEYLLQERAPEVIPDPDAEMPQSNTHETEPDGSLAPVPVAVDDKLALGQIEPAVASHPERLQNA